MLFPPVGQRLIAQLQLLPVWNLGPVQELADIDSRVPVIVSVLLDTMMLAVLGGAIGAAVTWATFDGFTASTAGAAGQVVFAFDVSPDLLWNGLKWALAIGFLGGLFPAVRAARQPITVGLRDL